MKNLTGRKTLDRFNNDHRILCIEDEGPCDGHRSHYRIDLADGYRTHLDTISILAYTVKDVVAYISMIQPVPRKAAKKISERLSSFDCRWIYLYTLVEQTRTEKLHALLEAEGTTLKELPVCDTQVTVCSECAQLKNIYSYKVVKETFTEVEIEMATRAANARSVTDSEWTVTRREDLRGGSRCDICGTYHGEPEVMAAHAMQSNTKRLSFEERVEAARQLAKACEALTVWSQCGPAVPEKFKLWADPARKSVRLYYTKDTTRPSRRGGGGYVKAYITLDEFGRAKSSSVVRWLASYADFLNRQRLERDAKLEHLARLASDLMNKGVHHHATVLHNADSIPSHETRRAIVSGRLMASLPEDAVEVALDPSIPSSIDISSDEMSQEVFRTIVELCHHAMPVMTSGSADSRFRKGMLFLMTGSLPLGLAEKFVPGCGMYASFITTPRNRKWVYLFWDTIKDTTFHTDDGILVASSMGSNRVSISLDGKGFVVSLGRKRLSYEVMPYIDDLTSRWIAQHAQDHIDGCWPHNGSIEPEAVRA